MKILYALAALLVGGCAYNHKQFPVAGTGDPERNDFVVQFDDYGQIWDQSEADRALARISSLARRSNVVVSVFVHGWHHDANPKNKNLTDFRRSIADIRSKLTDEAERSNRIYRESRRHLTGSEELTMVSVYVGWRGRSLPGMLDYLTFWGRKPAAERVGSGDLREFMSRLNMIYEERLSMRNQGRTKQFMGLTAIGHSFGAQVLFKAVQQDIEKQLMEKTVSVGQGHPNSAKVSDLRGYGDLVVLLNPAMEAMQYERIWKLSSSLEFSTRQSPVMLVISSAGDLPRQVFFPAGRLIDSAMFRPGFREKQRQMWIKALGEHRETRTHSLHLHEDKSDIFSGFDPSVYSSNPDSIRNFDLTRIPAIGGVELKPNTVDQKVNPFIVAYADVKVLLNHTEIFEEEIGRFLTDYIAIVQGKRLLANDGSE
jgi:hypothetical protein